MASEVELRHAAEDFIYGSDTFTGLTTLGGYTLRQSSVLNNDITVKDRGQISSFRLWVRQIAEITGTQTTPQELKRITAVAKEEFPHLIEEAAEMQVAEPLPTLAGDLEFQIWGGILSNG